jgi:hypothetical protein
MNGPEVASRRMRRPPLHPLLFAVYPVVFIYAQNVRADVSPRQLVLPLLVSVGVAGAVFVASSVTFRDVHRAAIPVSAAVILSFSYGHVDDLINPAGSWRPELLLLLAWGLLFLASVLVVIQPRKGVPKATGILDVVAFVLCFVNVVPIVRFEMGSSQGTLDASPVLIQRTASGAAERDIYYLIFDRYAADRTLRDVFGFDNGDFYDRLEEEGFYVARDSLANYPGTAHSLASSLNMTYLDGLAAQTGRDSVDWDPLLSALGGSRVATSLQGAGYRYYHIGSWWGGTGFDPVADENLAYGSPTALGDVLYDSTILPPLARLVGLRESPSFELLQYRRVWFQLEALNRISHDPGPTFTFAHFTLPHAPYVFHADGSFVSPEEAAERPEEELYLQQLAFANEQIETLIDDLLSGPTEDDPIVVLQSDEGPHPPRLEQTSDKFVWADATEAELEEKLQILNAYYLPGVEDSGLYPTISPVNSFRVILRQYFDADLPLLPDKTLIFESYVHPYRFTDVTTRLRP